MVFWLGIVSWGFVVKGGYYFELGGCERFGLFERGGGWVFV